MKKRRRTYSGSFKARIVSELLNGKKTLIELAEENAIHPNQIKNWKSVLLRRGSEILEDKRRGKKAVE